MQFKKMLVADKTYLYNIRIKSFSLYIVYISFCICLKWQLFGKCVTSSCKTRALNQFNIIIITSDLYQSREEIEKGRKIIVRLYLSPK